MFEAEAIHSQAFRSKALFCILGDVWDQTLDHWICGRLFTKKRDYALERLGVTTGIVEKT